jgi:hypothetical protein
MIWQRTPRSQLLHHLFASQTKDNVSYRSVDLHEHLCEIPWNQRPGTMVQAPKYLTGDPSGINDFIDRFDVRSFEFAFHSTKPILQALTLPT